MPKNKEEWTKSIRILEDPQKYRKNPNPKEMEERMLLHKDTSRHFFVVEHLKSNLMNKKHDFKFIFPPFENTNWEKQRFTVHVVLFFSCRSRFLLFW